MPVIGNVVNVMSVSVMSGSEIGLVPDITIASQNMVRGQLVRVDALGKIEPAIANSVDNAEASGVIIGDVAAGEVARIVSTGIERVLLETGLLNPANGSVLYLSQTQSGRATFIKPIAGIQKPIGTIVDASIYPTTNAVNAFLNVGETIEL